MSYPDLEGRTFIVTGASSGMGRSTALLLAQQGANVGLLDLYQPNEIADQITELGGKCLPLQCNVQDPAQVDVAVESVVRQYGALHGAANMAGIAGTRKTKSGNFPLISLDDEDWDAIVRTNMDGVKNCLRAQLRAMNGPGSIVNAASTAGQYGPPNCSPYVSSKWAVIGLTKTAAKECGKKGIRVNAVAPGIIQTALTATPSSGRDAFLATTALGRIGQPEEVARTILFLLSDQASFITASVLNVDGGYF
ncbi:dehydrogenase [Aspergillus sergii]|uniref:Dehydrogenase n=1 Tax=Aspergillus sergii TaxID=1034303 RepID=A0A5N6XFD9_9EURO|nr:dehydrogenase [Aspergillus sergii]